MKLIEKYILRNIAISLTSILVGCVTLSWLVEILGKINIITTKGQNILTFLYLSVLFIPSILIIVLPFALTLSIIQILYALNRDSEMIIIANTKKGLLYIWRPIILIAAVLSCILFFTANFISPLARIDMRELMVKINANFLTDIMQEDHVIEIKKKLYLKIGQHRLDSSLTNIFIADERDKTNSSYYYAKSATIIDKLLVMHNGIIAQHNYTTNENSLISFTSYNINLADFMPVKAKAQFYPKDLPLNKLLHHNDAAYKAELHYRLTSWLYPLIFVIFTLNFLGKPKSYREATNYLPIYLTILSCLSIYIIGILLKNKAQTNINYALGLYLLPLLSLLLLNVKFKLNFIFKK